MWLRGKGLKRGIDYLYISDLYLNRVHGRAHGGYLC